MTKGCEYLSEEPCEGSQIIKFNINLNKGKLL